ncbi:PAAR domain-containing protein [Herbaspirillum robiniae]|uniref:PAAR domain-containing protein n=1 Tax=Herbaspirillum robiniae TaxID=2014887 RepID=UPI003D76F6A4
MRGVIRQGDRTSHGGQVIATSPASEIMGLAVACVGDACSCPQRGHDDCVIVEGDSGVTVNGRAVAFDGHKTSCGARLISSLSTSGRI